MARAGAVWLSYFGRRSHLPSIFKREPIPSPPPPHHHQTLSFSTSPAARTRALRPSRNAHDDGDADTGGGEKSRNALKREARRAVRWGMDLASFSAPQLKQVIRAAKLERELLEALILAKRMGPDVKEGKRRQFNYIGRLLRMADPELMDALIKAFKDGDNDGLNSLSAKQTWAIDDDDEVQETTNEGEDDCGNHIEVADRWFDGLIYKDPSITNEVFSVHSIDFDRQELRKLIRRAQLAEEKVEFKESETDGDNLTARAKNPLICFLRSLAKKSLSE